MSSIKILNLLKLKDYITLIGTTLGIIAIICACMGTRAYISLGFFLISITLGTDLIDGYVARKTKTVNEIGKELDSLSDSLTFGIAPAILTFQAFRTNTIYDIVIIIGALFFVFGAILRLARFNISEVPGYTGLPTPISALILITYFYANYFFAFGMGGNNDYPFLVFTSYLIPVFMVFFAWFNVTTFIRFSEKDKIVYVVFIIIAPLCPIFCIIGILNPNFYVSMGIAIFFLASFLLALILIIRGFFLHFRRKEI